MKILKYKYRIAILIILIIFFSWLWIMKQSAHQKNLVQPTTFGVSFEPSYATFLGLDPKEIYQDMLTNMQIKHIRLNAYWDKVEPKKDEFTFEEVDYYLDEAQKNNAKVILAVGFKLPRWPECRPPAWIDMKNISYLRERQLIMVERVIKHYRDNPTIEAFQIENEALLPFGICPTPDGNFLTKEMELVRTWTNKPLLLTYSGEARPWVQPMRQSDIFGTTLYRKVYDRYFGHLYYPIPPIFYTLKSDMVRKLFAPNNQKTIIAELQTEIWTARGVTRVPIEEQARDYPLNDLMTTVEYSKKTGFDEVYMWGVEWWYFMAKKGHPEYLEYAKTLF